MLKALVSGVILGALGVGAYVFLRPKACCDEYGGLYFMVKLQMAQVLRDARVANISFHCAPDREPISHPRAKYSIDLTVDLDTDTGPIALTMPLEQLENGWIFPPEKEILTLIEEARKK